MYWAARWGQDERRSMFPQHQRDKWQKQEEEGGQVVGNQMLENIARNTNHNLKEVTYMNKGKNEPFKWNSNYKTLLN